MIGNNPLVRAARRECSFAEKAAALIQSSGMGSGWEDLVRQPMNVRRAAVGEKQQIGALNPNQPVDFQSKLGRIPPTVPPM